MEFPEHYTSDLLFYFDGKPRELTLYQCLVAVAVEPYPGRWTHHVVFSREEQADQELMDWIGEAFAFSQSKR